MASPSERNRNNVKAGLFVSVSLLLAFATTISLTDIWQNLSRPTHDYTVIFSVREGVKNLKPGGKVRVGGVDMGTVTSVMPDLVPGEPVERILVTFELDIEIQLYDGAIVLVTPALIGADAWLDITDVGDPARPLPTTGIDGFSAPGILTMLVGSENAKKANTMFDGAMEAVDNVRVATDDVRALTGRIRHEDWPQWAVRIRHIVDWGADATEQLDRLMDEGEGFLASAHDVIADNRDSIDAIAANVELSSQDLQAIMTRFRSESMDQLDRMLDSGANAMAKADGILADLSIALGYWVPQFDETLADVRLSAQQIKLTAVELRRGPWKLLYRPSKDELEHELLYDSVRSFAFAAADMKASATAVERILDKHTADLGDGNAALFDMMTQNLLESMQAYEAAQQKLLDVLQSE